MEEVKPNVPERPRQYAYVCPDLHVTVTRIATDVKPGFKLHPQIPCPVCSRKSVVLPFGVTPNAKANFEWYTPTKEDLKALFSKAQKQDITKLTEMYANGMLASREIK